MDPKQSFKAITFKHKGVARNIETPVRVRLSSRLKAASYNFYTTYAIWDTGATNSVISTELAALMGLIPIGKVKTTGIHGTNIVDRFLVDVEIMEKVLVINLQVSSGVVDPHGNKMGFLVGMDIISRGDFALTMENGHNVFSFRFPSMNIPIDFKSSETSDNSSQPPRLPLNRHERRAFEKKRRKKK